LPAGIAAAVVAVAVRAGIAARRAAIALLHDMGATDADIAGRFAGRAGLLVGTGALLGTLLAAPVLAGFADMASPLLGRAPAGSLAALPWASLPWAALALLPLVGAALGWVTAQATVRRWLRRLP
jgi:cell division transport system permease protein